MAGDLEFRISGDIGDLKAALADVKKQLEAAGSGGKGLKAASDRLNDTEAAARKAATAAERLARQQEAAAERAARAAEKQAERTARAAEAAADRATRAAERQAAKQVEAQRRAQESAARQATAQQRQLAPQLTDIGVGLATGQSPFMVALQQGGQLKDLYGGIVPAVKAVGTAVLGLINPLTIFGGALAVVAIGYAKGSEEGARFRRIVIETGGVAGTTADELNGLAASLGNIAGSTRGAAADTLAAVVQSGRFAQQQIEIVAKAAEQIRTSAGRDASFTIAEFAKIADDPVKGAAELNRQYGFLSGSLALQIRQLQEQGRTQEASTLAMQAYAKAVNDRAPKIRENLGAIEKAWRAVKEGAKSAGDALLDIGRQDTGREQFDKLLAQRQRLQESLASNNLPGRDAERARASQRARIEQITKQLAALSDAEVAAQKDASKKASQARAVAEQEQLAEEAKAFDSSQEKLTRERVSVVNRSEKALTDAQIAADDTAAREIATARDKRLAAIAREEAKVPLAVARTNAEVIRDDTDRQIEEVQRLYDRGLVSARDFFEKKQALQLQATQAEIEAQRAALATTQEPADIAQINAQIRILERKKADIRRDAIRDEARATQALQETLLSNEVNLQKAALDRSLRILQQHYDDGEIATIDYYEARKALQQAAIDSDLSLVAKQLESQELSPGDRDRLLAEQEKLLNERNDAARQAGRDRVLTERDMNRQLAELRAQELEAQGKSTEAARIRLDEQFRELRKRLQKDGNTAGVAQIDNIVNDQLVRAKFNELRAAADRIAQQLQNDLSRINRDVAAGNIDAGTGSEQAQASRQVAIDQLAKINAELQELAGLTKDPEILQGIETMGEGFERLKTDGVTGLDKAVQNLRLSIANMNEQFAQSATDSAVDGLADLFTSIADGSKSADDALKDFVNGFAKSMIQIAARALATYAVLTALDAIYPGLGQAAVAAGNVSAKKNHTGGMAGQGHTTRVNPMVFAGAPRYHSGGMVGLKPDERPAILQTGEEVLSRGDPRNAKNGGGSGNGTRVINVLDPSLVSGYLESAQGEQSVLNIIGRNPAKVQQLIR